MIGSKKGFSLIEIIVASAVFLTAIFVAGNIFVLTNANHKQAVSDSGVINDLQYTLDYLANRIQYGNLQLSAYADLSDQPYDYLVLREGDTQYSITKSSEYSCGPDSCENRYFLNEQKEQDGADLGGTSISSPLLTIEEVKFYIEKTGLITILLSASKYSFQNQSEKFTLQTTVKAMKYDE